MTNNQTTGSNTEGDKPVVSVSDAQANEGSSLIHTVTLSNPTSVAVSYPFSLSPGSATDGDDYNSNAITFSNGVTYNATTGSISIPAGITDFTVSYPALTDSIDELTETTTLTIGSSSGTAASPTPIAPLLLASAPPTPKPSKA